MKIVRVHLVTGKTLAKKEAYKIEPTSYFLIHTMLKFRRHDDELKKYLMQDWLLCLIWEIILFLPVG